MVVEEAWSGQKLNGWMGFVLKKKLKGLKGRIKERYKMEYGGLEDRLGVLSKKIMELGL